MAMVRFILATKTNLSARFLQIIRQQTAARFLLMKMENLLVTANLYSGKMRVQMVMWRQITAALFIIKGKCLLLVLTVKKLKALCLPQTKLQTAVRFIMPVS